MIGPVRLRQSNPLAWTYHAARSTAERGMLWPTNQVPERMHFDVFISHASEDKDAIARPLAEELRSRGFLIWFDEFELTLGDSLRRSIESGLANARAGLVVLSPSFFAKEWPQRELDGLTAREIAEAGKIILPVWHHVDHKYVARYSPTLADKLAISSTAGVIAVADAVERALRATTSAAGRRGTASSAPSALKTRAGESRSRGPNDQPAASAATTRRHTASRRPVGTPSRSPAATVSPRDPGLNSAPVRVPKRARGGGDFGDWLICSGVLTVVWWIGLTILAVVLAVAGVISDNFMGGHPVALIVFAAPAGMITAAVVVARDQDW